MSYENQPITGELVQRDFDRVGAELEDFIQKYDLPRKWFWSPDHISIETGDIAELTRIVGQMTIQAEEIYAGDITDERDRLIAAIKLKDGFNLTRYRSINWLEVMEPKEDSPRLGARIDHVGFYNPDFFLGEKSEALINLLHSYELVSDIRSNPRHSELSIADPLIGWQLKFTDRLFTDIVNEGLAERYLHPVNIKK